VKQWRIDRLQCTRSLECKPGPTTAVSTDKEGMLIATGDTRGIVRGWKKQHGDIVSQVIFSGRRPVTCLAVSDDGERIAAGDDTGAVTIIHGEVVTRFMHATKDYEYECPVYSLAFTPDGERLVSGGVQSNTFVEH